jgi:hypothetical protein
VHREPNRDTEQGWHKNTSDNDNVHRNVAELPEAPRDTESRPEQNVAELPGASSEIELKPELDGTATTPHHQNVYEMESPVTQREGDTLPPPYAPTPIVENGTSSSMLSPVSPMTVIDTGSPQDEKPLR